MVARRSPPLREVRRPQRHRLTTNNGRRPQQCIWRHIAQTGRTSLRPHQVRPTYNSAALATTRRRKVDPSFLPDDLDKSTDDLHRSSLVLIHLHNSRAQNAKPNRKRVSMGTAMTVPTLWLPSRMSAWACAPTCASYPPPKSSRSRWWTPSPWM
jgi:hypothetical protein